MQGVFQVSCSSRLHRCVALFKTRRPQKRLPSLASQKKEVAFVDSAGEKQDVYPGRGRFYPTKPSPGRQGGDASRLLGEREALGAPEGVHPAEHQRLPAAAARPAARPVHGVGEQRLPRLSVRKHNVLSTVLAVQHE